MNKKIIIIYTFVLLLVGIGAIAFINLSLTKQVPTNEISEKNDIANVDVMSSKKTDLSFEVSGKVVNISKQVGDAVEQGEIIAKLDDSVALTQYNQAQSGVTIAKTDLVALEKTLKREELKLKDLRDNEKKVQKAQVSLIKENIASQQARISQANDALSNAKIQLSKYVLKSPVAGIITRQSLNLGEIANPNVSIATLEFK